MCVCLSNVKNRECLVVNAEVHRAARKQSQACAFRRQYPLPPAVCHTHTAYGRDALTVCRESSPKWPPGTMDATTLLFWIAALRVDIMRVNRDEAATALPTDFHRARAPSAARACRTATQNIQQAHVVDAPLRDWATGMVRCCYIHRSL